MVLVQSMVVYPLVLVQNMVVYPLVLVRNMVVYPLVEVQNMVVFPLVGVRNVYNDELLILFDDVEVGKVGMVVVASILVPIVEVPYMVLFHN